MYKVGNSQKSLEENYHNRNLLIQVFLLLSSSHKMKNRNQNRRNETATLFGQEVKVKGKRRRENRVPFKTHFVMQPELCPEQHEKKVKAILAKAEALGIADKLTHEVVECLLKGYDRFAEMRAKKIA